MSGTLHKGGKKPSATTPAVTPPTPPPAPPAPPQNPGLVGKYAKLFLTGLVGDVAYDKAKELFKQQIDANIGMTVVDCRGKLLLDFTRMANNPAYGKPTNLIAWHDKSRRDFRHRTENRFVTLLCKIPEDAQTGRMEVLHYLNGLDEEEFNQMLDLLEDDRVVQFTKRLLGIIFGFNEAGEPCVGALLSHESQEFDDQLAGNIRTLRQAYLSWRN